MTSPIDGVTGILQRLNPFLLANHCACHQAALINKAAFKDIEYLTTTFNVANTELWIYLRYTARHAADFKVVACAVIGRS
jgi:hypothetical protein